MAIQLFLFSILLSLVFSSFTPGRTFNWDNPLTQNNATYYDVRFGSSVIFSPNALWLFVGDVPVVAVYTRTDLLSPFVFVQNLLPGNSEELLAVTSMDYYADGNGNVFAMANAKFVYVYVHSGSSFVLSTPTSGVALYNAGALSAPLFKSPIFKFLSSTLMAIYTTVSRISLYDRVGTSWSNSSFSPNFISVVGPVLSLSVSNNILIYSNGASLGIYKYNASSITFSSTISNPTGYLSTSASYFGTGVSWNYPCLAVAQTSSISSPISGGQYSYYVLIYIYSLTTGFSFQEALQYTTSTFSSLNYFGRYMNILSSGLGLVTSHSNNMVFYYRTSALFTFSRSYNNPIQNGFVINPFAESSVVSSTYDITSLSLNSVSANFEIILGLGNYPVGCAVNNGIVSRVLVSVDSLYNNTLKLNALPGQTAAASLNPSPKYLTLNDFRCLEDVNAKYIAKPLPKYMGSSSAIGLLLAGTFVLLLISLFYCYYVYHASKVALCEWVQLIPTLSENIEFCSELCCECSLSDICCTDCSDCCCCECDGACKYEEPLDAEESEGNTLCCSAIWFIGFIFCIGFGYGLCYMPAAPYFDLPLLTERTCTVVEVADYARPPSSFVCPSSFLVEFYEPVFNKSVRIPVNPYGLSNSKASCTSNTFFPCYYGHRSSTLGYISVHNNVNIYSKATSCSGDKSRCPVTIESFMYSDYTVAPKVGAKFQCWVDGSDFKNFQTCDYVPVNAPPYSYSSKDNGSVIAGIVLVTLFAIFTMGCCYYTTYKGLARKKKEDNELIDSKVKSDASANLHIELSKLVPGSPNNLPAVAADNKVVL